METQDIPKENNHIETITNFFRKLINILFGLLIGFSFITSIALSYESGFIGWSIIGYKLMKVFVIITLMYFIMVISKKFVYKTNQVVSDNRNKRRSNFRNELKKEIIKEMKDGRSTRRRKSR